MRLRLVSFLFLFVCTAFAQHATAPNGHYPPTYAGDTFKGTVVATDSQRDLVTLEYRNGKETQQLVLYLDGGCMAPNKDKVLMHAQHIPLGTVMTGYYMPRKSSDTNNAWSAVLIQFHVWHGEQLREDDSSRRYPCGNYNVFTFRAYR